MLCQVPVDYHLKEFISTISVSSALTLADEVYIIGLSKLFSESKLISTADIVSPPANYLNIALCDLLIHWQPSTTYRFRFGVDFYRDPEDQPNPEYDVTYTTNPLPTIPSASPAFGSTDVVNNTTIRLDFDRKMRVGNSGNIYLYEVASPSNILIGTYSNLSNITLANDGASITFSTLGKLKANTQYYITSDANIYRDYDNFYLPQITSTSFYTFTTDQSTDAFPDLITIQFVTGDVAVEYIRYRNQSSNFDTVDSDISISDQYRYRKSNSNFDIVDTNMVSATTYNTGKLRADFPVSIFDAFDIFTTYNTGKLRPLLEISEFNQITDAKRFRNNNSSLDSNVDLDSSVGVIKPFFSSIDSEFDSTTDGRRLRRPPAVLDANFNSVVRGGKWHDYISQLVSNNLYRGWGTVVTGKLGKVYVLSPSGVGQATYTGYNSDILDYYTNLFDSTNEGENIRASDQYFLHFTLDTTRKARLRNLDFSTVVRTFTPVSTWNFGHSMAVSDDYSVLTQVKSSNPNKVFVYSNSTGSSLWEISNPLGAGYWFGGNYQDPSDFVKYTRNCLAVDSNYFVIGAPSDGTTTGTDGGRVYVYNVSTGSLVHTLINPNTGTNSQYDGFGFSVALYGNYLVVGAPRTELSGSGLKNGCVYVYNLTTGALVTTLNNPTTSDNGWFGFSVDINNNFVIVGAPDHSSLRGTAYLYKISDWSRTTLSQSSIGQVINSRFGFSVCLNSTHAVVGSPGVNSSGSYVINGRFDTYALVQY